MTLEHGLRTCLLATRLADRAGLDESARRRDVYYASLLRSIGCTSDAHEQAALFGDEIAARTELNLAAHLPPRQLLGVLARYAGARARRRCAGRRRWAACSPRAGRCRERWPRRTARPPSGWAAPGLLRRPSLESLNSAVRALGRQGITRAACAARPSRQAARFTQVAYDALLLHEHLRWNGAR